MLEAEALTLRGRLSDVSASLRPGEITAICGPNGAGKSSLLLCLAGLLAPDSGQVILDGAAIRALPVRERARAIGYLPQHGEIAWDLSVRNLITLGRLPHERSEPAVDAALRSLDLEILASRPVNTLSGGEKARVLLARVLAGEPHWILADEPLAALDLAHQLALIGHLRRAADAGAGVVLVLHDLALAMNHADRVLVLDSGVLAADGGPAPTLSAELIERVWRVPVRWLGNPGARALVAGQAASSDGIPSTGRGLV